MTTVRTQSITNGQIGQINDRLATKLRGSGLPSESVQGVLKMPGNAAIDEMAAVFHKHVEAMVNHRIIAPNGAVMPEGTIVRRTRVNRDRTPRQVVDATGRRPYIDADILATMPQGEGDKVDVYFIPTKRFVPAKEVPAFLAQYGLVPDPRAQAAVNEADPAFADEHPNGSQWGNNCYLTFRLWIGERSVGCNRSVYDWGGGWFLSGVPAPRK